MNRIQPFKQKKSIGKEKWYEKINMTYNANAKNQLQTTDSLLFTNESLKKMRYGIQHRIPISSSFKILKHITASPTANYTERWYFNRIEKSWNEDSLRLEKDTIPGMRAVREILILASV